MAITFNCPGCGKPLKIRDEMAGQTSRCNSCSAKLVVPPASGDSAVRLPSTSGGVKTKHGPAQQSGRTLWLIAAGLFLAVMCVIVLWLMLAR